MSTNRLGRYVALVALAIVATSVPSLRADAAPAKQKVAKKAAPAARKPIVSGPKAKAKAKAPPLPPEPEVKREDEAPPPYATDPDKERILRVQEALYSLVHGPVLGRVRTAIRVMEARSGRVLYARRSDALMDPASNQKILATAAALYRLGNQFRYRTHVLGALPDDDGVIAGDLVLRGSGDPTLMASDLDALANQLAAQGVRKVTGDIVADKRFLGADEATGAGRSPLSVSRAAIVVRVRPGERTKARPLVMFEPSIAGIVISNRATTVASGRTRVSVKIGTQGGRILIDVAGRISIRHAGVVFRRRPSSSLLYAAALLSSALDRRGVLVTGGPSEGPSKAMGDATLGKVLLAHHQSAPLPELMRPINKSSNNEYADRLVETLGAQMFGGAPSMDKGLRALRAALSELGVPEAAYHATNGSGLGHTNRISADALTNLLRSLYFDPRVGPELMQSLSVGGVDGTTKHRFTGSVAAHRVRAKTGTLNGKSCLSGYVGDESEILIFSVMVDRMGGRSVNSVRKAQVQIVETLMGYAKGLVGDAAEERPDPATDFEAGEDVIELEEGEPDLAPPPPSTPESTPGSEPDPGGA